jgi:hypothetical protein
VIKVPTKVFNEKYPDVVFTHPTFGLENDVYKARISTQMIQLSFFDDRDDLYLVSTFENELPSEKCHVSNREQGIPSRHRLSVTVDGVELFSKKRGFILSKNGPQFWKGVNLPVQRTSTNNPLVGMRIDASAVDATLPTKVWKQYGQVRVLYKRLDIFYEIRDNQWNRTVTVYRPVRCVM